MHIRDSNLYNPYLSQTASLCLHCLFDEYPFQVDSMPSPNFQTKKNQKLKLCLSKSTDKQGIYNKHRHLVTLYNSLWQVCFDKDKQILTGKVKQ